MSQSSGDAHDGRHGSGSGRDAAGPDPVAPDQARPADPVSAAGSAPWERPPRWNRRRLDATRVDDLLARLGNQDDTWGRRRRRGQPAEQPDTDDLGAVPGFAGDRPVPEDDTPARPDARIPASELIAALRANRSATQRAAGTEESDPTHTAGSSAQAAGGSGAAGGSAGAGGSVAAGGSPATGGVVGADHTAADGTDPADSTSSGADPVPADSVPADPVLADLGSQPDAGPDAEERRRRAATEDAAVAWATELADNRNQQHSAGQQPSGHPGSAAAGSPAGPVFDASAPAWVTAAPYDAADDLTRELPRIDTEDVATILQSLRRDVGWPTADTKSPQGSYPAADATGQHGPSAEPGPAGDAELSGRAAGRSGSNGHDSDRGDQSDDSPTTLLAAATAAAPATAAASGSAAASPGSAGSAEARQPGDSAGGTATEESGGSATGSTGSTGSTASTGSTGSAPTGPATPSTASSGAATAAASTAAATALASTQGRSAAAGAAGAAPDTAAATPDRPATDSRSRRATGGGASGPPSSPGNRSAAGFGGGRHRGWVATVRSVVALVAVMVLVVSGVYWNIKRNAQAEIDSHSVPLPDDIDVSTPATTVNATRPAGNPVPAGAEAPKMYPPENILLMGSDTRSGANGNDGNTGADTGDTAQSDTLMIAHVSGDRQRVTIVSIPRDLRVDRVDCQRWDPNSGKLSDEWERVTEGATGKITNAYSVGGPTCSTAFVQKLTGLNIDRVISIDFEGFKTMVNALGGINVNICKPINDRELQWIVKQSGPNIPISGDQALSLVRARKVIGDSSGDIGRIRRQQVVLSTMLRKATSSGTLTNPGKLNDFLTAFAKSTNTANVNIDTLVQLRKQLGDLSPGKITFYTLPTHPDPRNPDEYRVADKTADAVWEALRNDSPLPGQPGGVPTAPALSAPAAPSSASKAPSRTAPTTAATSSRSTAPPTPQTIDVDLAGINLTVYNVAGSAGVAGEVRDQLEISGFDIPDSALVRLDDQTQSSVQVLYSAGNRDAAAAVAAAVPQATLKERSDLGDEVRLMVGSGWDGQIDRVRAGQTLPSRLQTTPAADDTSAASSTGSATTSSPKSTGSKPTSTVTIKSSDIASVNAAETTDCA